VWEICLLTIIGMVLIVIPFCIFYYEGMDADNKCGVLTQAVWGLCYAFLFLILFIGVLLLMWFLIGVTNIQYTAYSAILIPVNASIAYDPTGAGCWTYANQVLQVPVSIYVYAIALFALVGWVFLIVFGGVGLSSLPIDLIMSWVRRPRPITLHEYGIQKQRIAQAVQRLGLKGKTIEDEQRAQGNRISNALARRINHFKLDVAFVEDRYRKLELSHKAQGGSVFLPWLWLLLGIISIIISLAWIAHIIAWNILQKYQFLNLLFIVLDKVFPLFGVIAYGSFTFYLLWACVKGVTKVGMRLLFFEVHPMKLRDTLMNAFLFNCALILVVSVTVIQFAAQSFEPYASNTAVQALFTTYIQNLLYIGLAFRYFPYVLLAFFFLGALFSCLCRPRAPRWDD
jgi:LMBR1 domain-containing protein 1